MICCSNNLGRFPHNKPIDTGILVTAVGDYIIRLEAANGNTFELVKTVDPVGTIIFEVGDLNENMEYTFTVEAPDESMIKVNDCEFFKLKTIINTQIDHECTNNCDDTDNPSGYYS